MTTTVAIKVIKWNEWSKNSIHTKNNILDSYSFSIIKENFSALLKQQTKGAKFISTALHILLNATICLS